MLTVTVPVFECEEYDVVEGLWLVHRVDGAVSISWEELQVQNVMDLEETLMIDMKVADHVEGRGVC